MRICERAPHCCGAASDGFYTGSLLWDDECVALRSEVCRISPDVAPWKPGQTATPTKGKVSAPVFLRGAIGAFEGIVTDGTGTYAEGWACDPDFPAASSPIQVSLGGPLGSPVATLTTAIADQPLAANWRALVATECGQAGRHGFRFRLPANFTGEVWVYAIDLNGVQTDATVHAVGAPFSLLRGGKKTVPTSTPPRAAFWTGWIQVPATDTYSFCRAQPGTSGSCTSLPPPVVNPPGADLYRIWVNGHYVDGNWVDAPGPGAFTEPPPQATRFLKLQANVHYPVRIEFLRPATLPASSQIALMWARDGAAPALVPTSALHPMAQTAGKGLLGTFFAGAG
jgi:hypothetical protein